MFSRSAFYSSSLKGIRPDEIFLEESSVNGEKDFSRYSEYDSYYSDDDSSYYSSIYDESPLRKFPTSRLDMQKLENLYRDREKMNKNKLERKQKKQKVEDEKRKTREEKERAQQELIMAEKQKLADDRDRQREASKRGLK